MDKSKHNICDTHMHVVPDFDDGSVSLKMSLEMLSQSYLQGVRKIFCTSHSWYYIFDKSKYDLSFASLKEEAKKQFPDLEILTGSEVYCGYDNIDENIDLLDIGIIPTMNGSRYVLTEFDPGVEREEAMTMVTNLLSHNYIPIIAHAERYVRLLATDIFSMIKMGCKIQINLYSLCGEQNRKIKRNAEMYLRGRLVNFIGSDAHRTNYRPPVISPGIKRLSEICNEKYIREICFDSSKLLTPVKQIDM